MYVYWYMYAMTIEEKAATNLREIETVQRGLRERKR